MAFWGRRRSSCRPDSRSASQGASLVLDTVDKLHPGVQALAEALERHFRTDVQANMYAAWHPTQAFGVHWDDYDGVVVQLEETKRWNLDGATCTDPLRLNVEAPAKPEGPPLAEVVLQAGATLYLPRGQAVSFGSDRARDTWHRSLTLPDPKDTA